MGASDSTSTFKWKTPPGFFQPDGVFGFTFGGFTEPL